MTKDEELSILDDLRQQCSEAARKIQNLECLLREAREEQIETERALRQAELRAIEPPDKDITVEALRERIANHARAHETGKDDLEWKLFRRALAELARRAEGGTVR